MTLEEMVMLAVTLGAAAYIVAFMYSKIREQLERDARPVQARTTWLERLADKLHGIVGI